MIWNRRNFTPTFLCFVFNLIFQINTKIIPKDKKFTRKYDIIKIKCNLISETTGLINKKFVDKFFDQVFDITL